MIRAVSGAIIAIFAAILVVGAPSALAAKEREPVVLEPSSPWNLNYADDSCRLARVFGGEENRHLLYFEQSGPSESFGMTVAGPAVRKLGSFRNLRLSFRNGVYLPEAKVTRGKLETFGTAAAFFSISLDGYSDQDDEEAASESELINLPAVPKELANEVERITLSTGRHVILETGNMKAPFKALNTCSLDIVKHWGLDPKQHVNYRKLPELLNERSVHRRIIRAYPSQALVAGEEGFFRMRVIVEADGSVSDCALQAATKVESLESPGCKEFRRAKFSPALDSKGEPMRSYYATSIRYTIN